MKIRQAQLSDLPQLAQLFDSYRIFYRKSSDLDGAKQFLSERIQNRESIIYVVEENDVLVAFTQLYPLFSSTRMQKLWLLNDLFVAANQRGNGYSKALIERAKELCKESEACGFFLETEISNSIGNKLYPSAGMNYNDTSNFYYWDI